MMSNRKSLALVLVVLLIGAIAVGASGVLAQDTAPGFGWRHEGMMGSGPTMWSAVAEALDMDTETLWTALRSGQTLEAIAEAQGVELDAVYEAATATMTEHVNAMVEAGVITQEQADEHLAWMHDNLGQIPMTAMGEGCGMAMGMRMGMANADCPMLGEDAAMMPGMRQGMMSGMGHMGGMMGGSNMDHHRGHRSR